MKSKHVVTFNHDPWAGDYDKDVLNEGNPIRAGYEELLSWIANCVPDRPDINIVDLGSGTGNLTVKFPVHADIVAVDTSTKMIDVAKEKLSQHSVTYTLEDILSFVTEHLTPTDAIVSTYALHHLTPGEKKTALCAMAAKLNPGGIIAIGDLMFETTETRAAILDGYVKSDEMEIVTDIEEEFFWNIEQDFTELDRLGFQLDVKRFSTLSWGVTATLL